MLLGRKRCCCSACTYFHAVASSPGEGQVTFQAALDNDLITELSGTWAVDGGGRLNVTGSGAIRLEVLQPDSASLQRLEWYGNLGLSDNHQNTNVRMSVDYTDDNNRHYAEGKAYLPGFGGPFSFGYGKIARVSGGSETVLAERDVGDFSISFRETDPFLATYLSGTLCIHGNTVSLTAGQRTSNGQSALIIDPAVPSAGPVGGYLAAIEVEQDSGKVFTFDQIRLTRVGSTVCPEATCLSCFAISGCQQAPAQMLATIAGVADDGISGSANFNGGFALDLVHTYRPDPSVFGGCVELACYASAAFALASTITIGGVPYYYGRVYLQPVSSASGCVTLFRLYLAILQSATSYCTNAHLVGVMEPTSGEDVSFDCSQLDEAAYSGGGSTGWLDTTAASFTVSAV